MWRLQVRFLSPGPIGHWPNQALQAFLATERGTVTPPASVLPEGFTTAISAVTEILTGMFTLISDIVFPDDVTAISALAAFGLLTGVLLFCWGLVKKFSNG